MTAVSRFERSEIRNSLWKNSDRGHRITVGGERFIAGNTTLFAMGSCFAVELRRSLRGKGFKVYPDYPALEFDLLHQTAGRLPERDNINHYDTFAIRQEIERAVDRRRWLERDFLSLPSNKFARAKNWPEIFQDPTRRHVYASSLRALSDISDKISACIDDGFARADVIILTLGLTECWRVKSGGLYAALGPASENDGVFPLLEFMQSGFAENLDNLRATLDAIWTAYPDKRIVLTVSPVRLTRTWTNDDVVSANLRSKATLLAAVSQVRNEYPHLIYWPSFEFSMSGDIYREDGVHVHEDAVETIVDSFLDTYRTG